MRLALAFGMALAIGTTVSAAPVPEASLDRDISRLVELFSDGQAYNDPAFRHVVYGKVFGGSRNDAIALFSIEGFQGGNLHAEYLAFFQAIEPQGGSAAQPFRLVAVTQIGGRGSRTFDWETARLGPGGVRLVGKRWGPDDASCCPSLPVSVSFRVKEGWVREGR